MIIKGAKYVCDCCGKEVFVEQIPKEIKEKPGYFMMGTPLPEGWVRYGNGMIACEDGKCAAYNVLKSN